MTKRRTHAPYASTALAIAALLAPSSAHAYAGPGSIITGIGALLAVVAAIGAALFGFVWYPLKKLVRFLRRGRAAAEPNPMQVREELARD